MRYFLLKNGKTLDVDLVKTDDASDIINYTKTIGGESDFVTFGPEGIPISLEDEKIFLSRFTKDSLYPMFVGRIEGEIVSIANLSGTDRPRLRHNAELGLSVIKKYWHVGVGKAMMQVLIEHAKDTSVIENIYLKVRSDNINAIHLYETFGFKKMGTYPRQLKVSSHYYDTILMALLIE